MKVPPFDAQERRALCDLFTEVGPSAPTLLEGWTANDLAAHIVLRERDLVAGPCIALPGPFQRFAETRRAALAKSTDFTSLIARIRIGPPIEFFRIGWVSPRCAARTSACKSNELLADAAVDPLTQQVGVTEVTGVLVDHFDQRLA